MVRFNIACNEATIEELVKRMSRMFGEYWFKLKILLIELIRLIIRSYSLDNYPSI